MVRFKSRYVLCELSTAANVECAEFASGGALVRFVRHHANAVYGTLG